MSDWRKRNPRIIECACCGRVGYHNAHGWIKACYHRWLKAGQPAEGPPPLSGQRKPQPLGTVEHRLATYRELTRELGLMRWEAAVRLDITERTAERYEARLRGRVQQEVA